MFAIQSLFGSIIGKGSILGSFGGEGWLFGSESRLEARQPGVIIEINESKFRKHKYQRGHCVECFWVLGGVERTEQRKVFAQTVPN
jgi:hypothetical protein